MRPEIEDAAIQSDSYIDALLAGHAREPIAWPAPALRPEVNVRHVIRLLEHGLPRFHPSFLFEERLAQQLRDAAATTHAGAAPATLAPFGEALPVDRRLLMGGALASGVSLAGAAVLAWRRRRN